MRGFTPAATNRRFSALLHLAQAAGADGQVGSIREFRRFRVSCSAQREDEHRWGFLGQQKDRSVLLPPIHSAEGICISDCLTRSPEAGMSVYALVQGFVR